MTFWDLFDKHPVVVALVIIVSILAISDALSEIARRK